VTEEPPLPVRTLDHCLACGGRRMKPLPLVYEYRGRFPAAECQDCGMRFLSVQPTAEGLAELYTGSYFEKDFRCGRSDTSYFAEDVFRAENEGLLDEFARLGPPGRLLEIGSAGGWLLKHAAEHGWQAKGIELSAEAVAHARTLGLDVFHGDLAQAALPAASFDLVYMGDVLEHVPDCRATLVEVVRVLKPGGHFYLRGPTTTNSIARQVALAVSAAFGKPIVLREPPYHLWEFRPGPLARLFEASGLVVVERRESKIPHGRPHGEKSPAERAAMAAFDTVNLPLTRAFNVAGDRIVMVGRKRT
jgi:SAM-dependent methyltransferase